MRSSKGMVEKGEKRRVEVKTNKREVVVLGGGTGTHTVLSGLKQYADRINLRAVVAMSDSGGSTGRLRDEFGYLPVGDVRMALVGLANGNGKDGALLRKLFLHRFGAEGSLSGHNVGNLLLIALTDILGSEEAAIEAASRVLRVSGTVIPVTTSKVHLVAHYSDGSTVTGEHDIDAPGREVATRTIRTLSLTPQATINPRARDVILGADLIVLGPGDLYTSILANCVVSGIPEALQETKAKLVYVSNLMTRAGQTTGMCVREHVQELERYIGRHPDIVFTNTTPLAEELLRLYAEEQEFPVLNTADCLPARHVSRDFLAEEQVVSQKGDVVRRSLIRHDPQKLAAALIEELG